MEWARLYGESAEDRGDDCCDEFKDFRNLGPVYFNHNEHELNELNEYYLRPRTFRLRLAQSQTRLSYVEP